MAKTHCMRYCNLIDEAGFDQFAHLDTLRMVIKQMPDAELVEILKERRQGGRQDWPVEAMPNAFYATLVQQYRSVVSQSRNLATNPTLMQILTRTGQNSQIRVPSRVHFVILEVSATGGSLTWCG